MMNYVMKVAKRWGSFVIAVALTGALAFAAAGAGPKRTNIDKLLKDEKLVSKLDASLRARLRSLATAGLYDHQMDMVVKLRRELPEKDRSGWRGKGIQIQSTVGDVVTVHAPAVRVYDMAKNAKVDRIELPRTIPRNPPQD